MKWAWKIARIGGIDVFVHATFLILLAWVALTSYRESGSLAGAARGVAFITILFSIVVMHEFGHALTARRFGIRARDITLLPIGGVARLERMPDVPWQELLVAVAGPAVNVLLAGILFLVLLTVGDLPWSAPLSIGGGGLLTSLLWINVSLALFNLLPAFPMDGGRVLRALLAMRMDYVDATQTAATIGQGMALLFGLLGLLFNPFLIFIALFVWMGATQEAGMAQMRWALAGLPVRRAMITDFRTLAPDDSLARANELLLAGFQQDFPVVSDGRVVGVLTHGDLFSALAKSGTQTAVSDVMQREFLTAHPGEMLEDAFQRLSGAGVRSLPVIDAGELQGLLTPDNLGELLAIRSALRRGRETPR